MSHDLALRRYRDAGTHKTFLLQLTDPVGVVDVVPVVAVAVGAVDAARELEGFLGTHHADLQRGVRRGVGRPDGPGVLLLGELLPDVGVGQVLDELHPVAATPEIDETYLVCKRAVEDLDVVLPLLIRTEGVLDDVAADRFDRPIQVLGGFVPQPEPPSHLPHEVHRGGQELGVARHRDAGDGSLRFPCYRFIGHGAYLSTDSSSAPEIKGSPSLLPYAPARHGTWD